MIYPVYIMNLGAIGIYSLDIELLTRLYGLVPLSLKIGVLQQLKMLYITGDGNSEFVCAQLSQFTWQGSSLKEQLPFCCV